MVKNNIIAAAGYMMMMGNGVQVEKYPRYLWAKLNLNCIRIKKTFKLAPCVPFTLHVKPGRRLTRHSSWPDLLVLQTSTLSVFCRSALWDICMLNTSLTSMTSWGREPRVRKRQRVVSTQGNTAERTYLEDTGGWGCLVTWRPWKMLLCAIDRLVCYQNFTQRYSTVLA